MDFIICGGLILTSISVILSSLSFWFSKSDIIADTGNSLMLNIATYPDGIFKGVAKILLFTIVPVGIVNYLPVRIISEFNELKLFLPIERKIIYVFTLCKFITSIIMAAYHSGFRL